MLEEEKRAALESLMAMKKQKDVLKLEQRKFQMLRKYNNESGFLETIGLKIRFPSLFLAKSGVKKEKRWCSSKKEVTS